MNHQKQKVKPTTSSPKLYPDMIPDAIPEAQGDIADRANLEIDNEIQGQIDLIRQQTRESEQQKNDRS